MPFALDIPTSADQTIVMVSTNTHRKTCRRYDEPGHAHFLTFSCFRRQPFFRSRYAPGWFIQTLDEARQHCGFALWAWVIMPEHVHLLLQPAADCGISDALWRIKRPVTSQAVRYLREKDPAFLQARMLDLQPSGRYTHRFWHRGGGHDRNIWQLAELREKVDYIHANPVRRGLVDNPADWPWSSWRAWHEGTACPISIDRQSFPSTSPKGHA